MALKEKAALIKSLSVGGSVLIHGAVLVALGYWPAQEKEGFSSNVKAVSVELLPSNSVEFLSSKAQHINLSSKTRQPQQKQKKQVVKQDRKRALSEHLQTSQKSMMDFSQQTFLAEKEGDNIRHGEQRRPEGSEEKKNAAVLQYKGNAYDNPMPVYPFIARQRHLEGRVVLKVLVGSKGEVLDITFLESSGYGCLDQSAVEAVEKWTFDPIYHKHGKDPVYVLVPISFRLDKTEIFDQ